MNQFIGQPGSNMTSSEPQQSGMSSEAPPIRSARLSMFQEDRIDGELLKTQPFLNALHLVEKSIGNPSLSVKFAQTCIESLRNEQLYDLQESKRHIPAIYSHLVTVLQNITIRIANCDDRWSCFTLGHKQKSSMDVITFDGATIRGAQRIRDDQVDDVGRLTFFFYAKLLHEIAHASISELGRKLPKGDYEARFCSPATHSMTGNAGDSIERHFFGSVTDAIGEYEGDDGTIYRIDQIILREKRTKQVITTSYFRQFVDLNFSTIHSIPLAITVNPQVSRMPSQRKRCESKQLDFTKDRKLCKKTQGRQWGWGPEADQDSDDDPKLICNAFGNPQWPVVFWKE